MKWFPGRKAAIPEHWRDVFEQFGVNVIGGVLGGGLNPRAEAIQPIYNDPTIVGDYARRWMTEQHKRAECQETWMITMEAAVTLFVFAELLVSIWHFNR